MLDGQGRWQRPEEARGAAETSHHGRVERYFMHRGHRSFAEVLQGHFYPCYAADV